MLATTVIYDILRDGIGAPPIVLTLFWLLGLAIFLWLFAWPARTPRPPSRQLPRGLVAASLVTWVGIGGFGFGNVFYRHYRCRAAAVSGEARVVEGPVTAYVPQDPHREDDVERITVRGETWAYSRSDLSRGGYRGVPPAKNLISVGSPVRISSYDGRILKLELLEH
jgi:hypothetical protein